MPLKEACGVLGIVNEFPVLNLLQVGLRALQHRGQESAGITISDNEHITQKGMGLVSEALSEFGPEFDNGTIGIGHVRYSTAGGSSVKKCPTNDRFDHLWRIKHRSQWKYCQSRQTKA